MRAGTSAGPMNAADRIATALGMHQRLDRRAQGSCGAQDPPAPSANPLRVERAEPHRSSQTASPAAPACRPHPRHPDRVTGQVRSVQRPCRLERDVNPHARAAIVERMKFDVPLTTAVKLVDVGHQRPRRERSEKGHARERARLVANEVPRRPARPQARARTPRPAPCSPTPPESRARADGRPATAPARPRPAPRSPRRSCREETPRGYW